MAKLVGKGKNRRCQTNKGTFTRMSACGVKGKGKSKAKKAGRGGCKAGQIRVTGYDRKGRVKAYCRKAAKRSRKGR